MNALIHVLVIVLGLAIGAWTTAVLMSEEETPGAGPINFQASLRSETALAVTLGPGWGRPAGKGRPLKAESASIFVDLPNPAEGDLVLDIQLCTVRGQPLKVSARVNGRPLESWQVGPTRGKRLYLPKALANERVPMEFTLAVQGTPEALLVEELRVHDVATLSGYAGFVDVCAGARVAGWAKAGELPSPLVLRRNGAVARTFVPNVERPDLAQAGHPGDAGFDFTLEPPAQPGEKIEVTYPNGRRVGGAACSP